ncbi:MAG TPA: hypothetical protein VFT65_15645, partial [Candidatus Angelobacter sp.]|nr:hypothetical protein [Candidatus Angelobacter sp.]
YELAGSPEDELRVLEAVKQYQALSGRTQNRYFELLLARNPQRLVQLSSEPSGRGDAAVNFIVAHADAALALPAVATRGASEAPVWRPAYTALVGLYFANSSAQIQGAFRTALAEASIGERLARPVDRKQSLAGDVWFYYGSRYGEYLGVTKKGDPEDYLPAELEHTPTRAAAYFTTALYYEDAGDLNRAVSDYQHVADLDSGRIDVHNRLAGIYWKQKHPDEASSEWRRALQLLKVQVTTEKTQETFWGDFAATVSNLASHQLLTQLQPEISEILHDYVKRNGSYRLQPLLESLLPRMESPGAASALLLDLSADTAEKLSFLRQYAGADTRLKLDREPIFQRLLGLAQDAAQKSEGVAHEYAQQEFESLQVQWLQYLLEKKQFDRVRSELASLPQSTWQRKAELVSIQLKVAAQAGGLDAILDGYRADVDHAPSAELLRKAATEFQQTGDQQSARKVLEFVFTREIDQHNLTAANMLGLAEIRIQSGDLESGVALLRRMTLVVGNPFETQDAAAALLVRTGHPAQGATFLDELVKAVPWNAQYRGRLAQAQVAAGENVDAARKQLAAIASDRYVAYEDRVAFGDGISGAVPGSLGSGELDFLAQGGGSAGNVNPDQPFFFFARVKAARTLPAKERVRLLRAALEDNPSGEAARVPLLKAASEAGDYHLSIAAMKPYLSAGNLENALNANLGTEDETQAEDQPSPGDDTSRLFARLPLKERAEISRELGTAFQNIKSLTQALPYLQRAYRLETDAGLKAQINKQVQQIRFTQRRQAANRARQPEIHSDLEQQHVVRPRLPEQAASSAPRTVAQLPKGGAR